MSDMNNSLKGVQFLARVLIAFVSSIVADMVACILGWSLGRGVFPV
jgi:hypothetical protein